MSDLKVIRLPLWRSTRQTALLLVAVGTLVLLWGMWLFQESLESESQLSSSPPPEPPRPSTSTPPTTSS